MSYFPTEEEEFELIYTNAADQQERQDYNAASTSASTSSKMALHHNDLNFSTSLENLKNSHNTSIVVNSELHLNQSPEHGLCTIRGESSYSSNPSRNINKENFSRKRKLEDLFGDINCYDLEDNSLKKIESKEDMDLELIKQILEARRINKEKLNPILKKARLSAAYKSQKHINISCNVPRWPFITVSHGDGERFYVRFHSTEFIDRELQDCNIAKHWKSNGPLEDDQPSLWTEAKCLLAESKRLANEQNDNTRTMQEALTNPVSNDKLWVETFRPQKYIELLSDEGTNRTLLKWLKMWDQVVFNREPKRPKLTSSKDGGNFNKNADVPDHIKFKKRKNNRFEHTKSFNPDLDEMGLPTQKIALLCGPPGLGKTTLAHTIARHAGYAVLELNASDDRSLESFRNILHNGTQMRTLKGLVNECDDRPNCIILDEIDGAPAQSIEFLIRFASGQVSSRTTSNRQGNTAKNSRTVVLRRPIICICNDLYVPALRQLRQYAFVVSFPPTDISRLAERLLEISHKQQLKTDLGTLLALAEKTNCDVRSCLCALQFFSGQKQQLRLVDIYKSNIGQKDMQKGMFATWKEVFQIRRPLRGSNVSFLDDESVVPRQDTDMSCASRVKNVLETVYAAGDYERLMQGVYENYLTMYQPDPDMLGVCHALEWFCFADLLLYSVNTMQNYSLYPYIAFGFVAWHLDFASYGWRKITFPTKGFEMQQRRQCSFSILEALRRNAQITSCGLIGSNRNLLLDIVAFLLRIIAPQLRSMAHQLLTPSERCDLRHTVNIMSDFGLSYRQSRSIGGTYQFQLEPDIDVIGLFKDIPQSIPTLSYGTQQLIAREVEVEKMRRSAPKTALPRENSSKNTANQRKAVDLNNKHVPNHLQTLQSKPIFSNTRANTILKDFFGRRVEKSMVFPSTSVSSNNIQVDAIVKSPIWYRYKEGCNQAVRRKVKMVDLT